MKRRRGFLDHLSQHRKNTDDKGREVADCPFRHDCDKLKSEEDHDKASTHHHSGGVDEHLGRGFKRRLLNLLENEASANRDTLAEFLETFFKSDESVTVDELVHKLNDKGVPITHNHVSKAMRILEEYELARRSDPEERVASFEHMHLQDHADHLICLKCGKMIPFMDEHIELAQQAVVDQHNFRPLYHRHQIYGVCEECAKLGDRQLTPMRLVLPNERAVIEQMAGGMGMRRRLSSMGLMVGDEITIVSRSVLGQMVILSGDKKIAIGREFSNRIFVSLLASGNGNK